MLKDKKMKSEETRKSSNPDICLRNILELWDRKFKITWDVYRISKYTAGENTKWGGWGKFHITHPI